MGKKLLYDRDHLVSYRDYASEALACIDKAVLDAADIPCIVQVERAEEAQGRVQLVVRYEHLAEVKELLDDRPRELLS